MQHWPGILGRRWGAQPELGRDPRGRRRRHRGCAVWAVQQPLDKRAFRSGYDDLGLLGKLVTREAGG
jgi:hypothetical protein